MITKKLKELYYVDTISQDKGWKKIQEALGELTEDIKIDFSNINVIEPWQCSEFKKLLRNEHVHMSFVNNEPLVNRIKMMCIIDGLPEDRIENVVVELPKEKTPEEKKIEQYGNELIPLFDINNDVATLELEKRYSQIQSTNTLSYIDYAIREIHTIHCIDKFKIKIGKLVVLPNVLQVLVGMMVKYESEGFHLLVDCDDNETAKTMGLFIHIETTNAYNNDEREKVIKKTLIKDMPGMLIKYKKSKALDEFGREGKGEVVSSRIAIFRGLEKSSTGETLMKVETFNSNYFYTVEHWMVEHDYEEPTGLHNEILEIPLNEVGICDTFLGSKYHFILPIQQDESESQVVIKEIDENGHNIKVNCTIPERMKIVFDSWNIKYDKESLDKSIEATKKQLISNKNGHVNNINGICDTY